MHLKRNRLASLLRWLELLTMHLLLTTSTRAEPAAEEQPTIAAIAVKSAASSPLKAKPEPGFAGQGEEEEGGFTIKAVLDSAAAAEPAAQLVGGGGAAGPAAGQVPELPALGKHLHKAFARGDRGKGSPRKGSPRKASRKGGKSGKQKRA